MTPAEADPRAIQPLEVHAYTGGAFAENSYLVVSPASRRSVVVDPGAAAPELLADADRLGVSIDAIYLTHGHVDHVEGIPQILEHTSAPIHLHPADLPLYRWAERRAIDWGIDLRGTLPDPDYEIILVDTDASLTKQYEALLATEGVQLRFEPDGVRRIAEIASSVNEKTETIGARRLSTVMEKLLEEVSFEATRHGGETIVVDAAFVDGKLGSLAQSEDLARYIL